MRLTALVAAFAAASCGASAHKPPSAYHLVPGAVPLDRGPDGNSVILDAPDGLIVVDTGRHPEHAQAVIDYAEAKGRPIAAIVNTHWHLDHTTGNWDIRQRYPQVKVYATGALDGALATYLKQSASQAEQALADAKTTAAQRDQIRRGRAVLEHPERIKPDRVIGESSTIRIAGRPLELHVARFAATEADLWLYDPETRTAIVGDLVVDLVPFLDTACADGWSRALNEVAAAPFVTLVPGHGAPMDRATFLSWKSAYERLLDCTRSDAEESLCIEGWKRDAAQFIDSEHSDYVSSALAYYIRERLRSPAEQERYCKPLSP